MHVGWEISLENEKEEGGGFSFAGFLGKLDGCGLLDGRMVCMCVYMCVGVYHHQLHPQQTQE